MKSQASCRLIPVNWSNAQRAPSAQVIYSAVGVKEVDGGLTVTLDGKPIKTPSRKVPAGA